MLIPNTLREFKEIISAAFSNKIDELNVKADEKYFDYSNSLKVYLVENNNTFIPDIPDFTGWKELEDSKHWFISHHISDPHKYVIYDNSISRVGILYTILKVTGIDNIVNKWIEHTNKLDHCWLSQKQLQYLINDMGWVENGIGLKYRNILEKVGKGSNKSTLSLKAWYGSGKLEEWRDGLDALRKNSTISSIRVQKIEDGEIVATCEEYNYGKITVSYAENIDFIISVITDIAKRYTASLSIATMIRDNNFTGFELNFDKKIDIKQFSDYVSHGRGLLKLWLLEYESSKDYKRFRGVDMHTWDVIYLDLAPEYAYITIPGNGCVNAVPRLAVLQGENISGNIDISFNGERLFV